MNIEAIISDAWEARDSVSTATTGPVRHAVDAALAGLDAGELRVASPDGAGGWTVHQWLKKAVLLSFRLNPNVRIPGGPGGGGWWDKVASKFDSWDDAAFTAAGFRSVPGAIVRRGAFVAPGAILMPSFVNIGARRSQHDGRYLDHGRQLRPDRRECPSVGRRRHRRRS